MMGRTLTRWGRPSGAGWLELTLTGLSKNLSGRLDWIGWSGSGSTVGWLVLASLCEMV
jgi:hypothetical protein